MNVWILNPYGNLPNESWRPHRYNILSDAFVEKGHKVTYWISNIDHRSKLERDLSNHHYQNLTINVVASSHYFEHISLKRVWFEVKYIRNFIRMAENEQFKPDIIILAEPALFISYFFVKFSKRHNLKFVVDFVDLWPEIFKIVLHPSLKRFDKIVYYPFYFIRKWFVKKASGIISVSKAYNEIALSINSYVPNKIIYWGTKLDPTFLNEMTYDTGQNLNVIYAGTLGDNYDINSIIECGKMIEDQNLNINIYIAGDGNLKNFVINSISNYGLTRTKYLGRLNQEDLLVHYKRCNLAFSTYSRDSTVSMPIKAFDYLSAGLPMLNSLGYDLGFFVENNLIGLNYKAEDVDDLFNKLVLLSNDKVLLETMRKNCLSLSTEFDQKILYPGYVEFCEDLVSKS